MIDSPVLHKEGFRMLCDDELIGFGMSREVFNSPLFPDCVVKVEDGDKSFQNVIEWNTWLRVKGTKHSKWFAPCVAISPCGAVLLQKKTLPVLKYPKKLPPFLGDTKTSNYGMYKSLFV